MHRYLLSNLHRQIKLHSKMPDLTRDVRAMEPYVRMEILTPSEYNGVSTCSEQQRNL